MSEALRGNYDMLGDDCAELTAVRGVGAGASAAIVNRTHRVVRERAKAMQAKKNRQRSLWAPLLVSGGLLAVLVCAVWSVLDQYEETAIGLPDASQQMLVLMMWCLPVSAAILGVVWMRRAGAKAERRNAR